MHLLDHPVSHAIDLLLILIGDGSGGNGPERSPRRPPPRRLGGGASLGSARLNLGIRLSLAGLAGFEP